MRALYFSLLAAVSIPASAVAEDQSDYFFPMSVGSEWIMDAKLVSPNGTVAPTTAHLLIDGSVEKDGHTYFRMRTWMELGAAQNKLTKLIREDATGIYSIEESEKSAAEQREVPFPLKINLIWQRTSRGVTVKDTVLGIDKVTIGGTIYENCLHFHTTTSDHKFTEDYWKAPHVGTVRSVMNFATGQKIILSLREFKPGS